MDRKSKPSRAGTDPVSDPCREGVLDLELDADYFGEICARLGYCLSGLSKLEIDGIVEVVELLALEVRKDAEQGAATSSLYH